MDIPRARQIATEMTALSLELQTCLADNTNVIILEPGDDLQSAILNSHDGDTIKLKPGIYDVGEFQFPARNSLTTLMANEALPDRRIGPSDVNLLPIIRCQQQASPVNLTNAANWKLDGISAVARPGGEGDVFICQDSYNIQFDRILFIGGPDGQKRGIRGNCNQISLYRSYIANCWKNGQDSQAYCSWEGDGQVIHDNYLEGAAENLLIGGADSSAASKMPKNISIVSNMFRKRIDWKPGQGFSVKNLLEFKCGDSISVTDNDFANCWTDAQAGWAIVLKVANQDGNNPYNYLASVYFAHNVLSDIENGINILGHDYGQPSGQSYDISIYANKITTKNAALQLGGQAGVILISDNDIDQAGNLMNLYAGDMWVAGTPGPVHCDWATEHLTYTNNRAKDVPFGIKGDGTASGEPSLKAFCKEYEYIGNMP